MGYHTFLLSSLASFDNKKRPNIKVFCAALGEFAVGRLRGSRAPFGCTSFVEILAYPHKKATLSSRLCKPTL